MCSRVERLLSRHILNYRYVYGSLILPSNSWLYNYRGKGGGRGRGVRIEGGGGGLREDLGGRELREGVEEVVEEGEGEGGD